MEDLTWTELHVALNEQENVSSWFIFLGQYPPHVPVSIFDRKMENHWKTQNRHFSSTYFLHMDGCRTQTHCLGSSFGSQLHLSSNDSQYTALPKMQISATRRVLFGRFKPKTYPHQLDSHSRALWIWQWLTFVPGLWSPPPDPAGVLPEPSAPCCRAGIWGAESANQGKTCFPSPPAPVFPAAGPDGESHKVSWFLHVAVSPTESFENLLTAHGLQKLC